ncbi:MAG: formate dehydrogenase accessory protein FdhE [Coriobacteriales bacterium]|nr:formate dehydrogenase accessory protein FdhE [Coriobacteriales bacterium]
MNLKWMEKAADIYRQKVDADTVARLDFFDKIWQIQADAEKKAAKENTYALDNIDELEDQYWAQDAIFIASPVSVDKALFAATAREITAVIAESSGLDKTDSVLLASWDWDALIAGADIALAGSNPQEYLALAAEAAQASVGEQASLVALILSLALRPQLEPAARAINEALASRLTEDNLEHFHRTSCPVCGGEATLAYVGPVPSGPQNGRQLWCGQCGTLWEFERVRCPRCGSQLQTSLHYTSIEGDDEHRIYHCDVCHGYVRTVFSTGLGGVPFAPEVEDVVMVNLDAIAQSKGLGPRD